MAIESYLGTQGMSGGDSEATWSAQCPVLRTVEREDVERCDAIKFKWLYTEKHIVDGVQQLEWWQIHDILTRVLETKARVVVNHGQSWIRTLDIFRATSECRIAKLLRIAHVASLLVDVQSKNDCQLPRFRWIGCFEPWVVQRCNHARLRVYICLDNFVGCGVCCRYTSKNPDNSRRWCSHR